MWVKVVEDKMLFSTRRTETLLKRCYPGIPFHLRQFNWCEASTMTFSDVISDENYGALKEKSANLPVLSLRGSPSSNECLISDTAGLLTKGDWGIGLCGSIPEGAPLTMSEAKTKFHLKTIFRIRSRFPRNYNLPWMKAIAAKRNSRVLQVNMFLMQLFAKAAGLLILEAISCGYWNGLHDRS